MGGAYKDNRYDGDAMKEQSIGGYQCDDGIKEMSINCGAMLRRLITMRGNSPASGPESMQNHAVLTQKIIELQGLLTL